MTSTNRLPLSRDILDGLEAIARFIWGARGTEQRARRAIARGLPVFRIGRRIHGRRSVIRRWIEDQEQRKISTE